MSITIEGKVIGQYDMTKQCQPISISNGKGQFPVARRRITLEFEPNNLKVKKGDRLRFDGKEFTVTYFEPGRIEGLTD